MDKFSFKELYSVTIKATSDIEINGNFIEKNETLCFFDTINLANFNTIADLITARGGWMNTDRVFWEDTKGMELFFSKGVINTEQFGILTNNNYVTSKEEHIITNCVEKKESDEYGFITLDNDAYEYLFVYDIKAKKKIKYETISNNSFKIKEPFKECLITYGKMCNSVTKFFIGEKLLDGEVSLEGKTKIKDDKTGEVKTMLLKIPKVRIQPNFSASLGDSGTPYVSQFKAKAYPVGAKGNTRVMDFFILDTEYDE